MAFDGDIGLKVRAVGLQQDIAKQARNAEKALQRSPVKLGLDSKGFTQPLGRITGNMSEFQKSLDASTARVFAFGATVGVINGIAEGFKAVVASVIEVEKALADINVVMGLSIERLQEFSEGLFEVARNTSQTFGTVATAATEFARQGLSAEETLKRVNDALILTRLSGLDAVKSVEALTAVVNGFAREGLNTTEIINRLANVDAAFAVSSKDLADALARSGATAQAAGVDFNELLAIVTSVQQQTARGGAVIGNAFKSIFTRLQRSKVRETLEGVGVATSDAFGNFRSAISILKDYAQVYDTLSDAQRAYTSEQIAGVFQVNNLKALVNDLNNDFSIYSQALSQAANTTDEATRRNEALNKTFAALGMQAGESLRELAQAFGEMSLEPAMMKVLQMLQTVIDSINSMLGEGDGDSMMSNFFKGMGNFIAGPGLALITAAFGKLFMVISKHALSAFKEMFKISSEAQRQKGLQESILQILMSDETVYRRLIAATGDQTKQSQILLGVIRKINTEYAAQQKLIASLAASPAMRGVAAGKGGFVGQTKAGQKKIGTAAEGSYPEPETQVFAWGGMPEVDASIAAGYTSTVQPQQVRQMNVPNLGRIMYNTQERVVNVPNLAQPFIVPPASSKAYPNYVNNVTQQFGEPMAKTVLGRAFTPKQRAYAEGLSPVATAQRVTEGDRAASGLVPNYAPVPLSMVSVGDPGSALRSIKNRDIAALLKRDNLNPQLADDGSNFNSNFTYEFKQGGKTIVGTGKELKAMFASQGGKAVMQQGSPLARATQGKDTGGLHKLHANTSMLVPLPMGKTALPEKVVVSGDQLLQKVDPREIGALSREKSLKLPQVYGKTKRREAKPGEAALLIKEQLEADTFEVGFKTSGIQEFEDDMTLRSAIDRDMKVALSDILERNAYKVLGKQSSTFKLNSTEIDARADNLVKQNTALTGLLFEDVISSAIQKSPVFSKAEQYRRWDFSMGDRPSLNEIFDQAVGDFSDAKRSPSPMAKISMGKKSLFATPQGQRILQGALNAAQGAMPTAATGLAPDAAYFSQVGKGLKAGKGRAKFFDVDDTLMDTSLAMKEMGIKPGDQRIYGDEKVAQNIARQAKPTLLGEKVKALKNKDNVFLLTDAGPERNQILAEKFDIPLNKIIALRDPAQISRYGLDSAVPSAQGIRRQTKDANYKLQEGSRDYRALKVREKKKKVIDKFRGMGVNPILYDDKLDIITEVGKYGKLMQFATPLAAGGMVPEPLVKAEQAAAKREGYIAGGVIPYNLQGQDSGMSPQQFIEKAGIAKGSGFVPNYQFDAVINKNESLLTQGGSPGAEAVIPPTVAKNIDPVKAREKGFNIRKAGQGFVPNFVPPSRSLVPGRRAALATKTPGSFDDFVAQKIIGKSYDDIQRWSSGVGMGIWNRVGVGNMPPGAMKALEAFNNKYRSLTNPLMGPLGPGKLPRIYESKEFAAANNKPVYDKVRKEWAALKLAKMNLQKGDGPTTNAEAIKKIDVEIEAKSREMSNTQFGRARKQASEEEANAVTNAFSLKFDEGKWLSIPKKQRDELRALFNSTPEISTFFKAGGYNFAEGLIPDRVAASLATPNFSHYRHGRAHDPSVGNRLKMGDPYDGKLIGRKGHSRGAKKSFADYKIARDASNKGILPKESVFVNKFRDQETYYIKGREWATRFNTSGKGTATEIKAPEGIAAKVAQDNPGAPPQQIQELTRLAALQANPHIVPTRLRAEFRKGTQIYRVKGEPPIIGAAEGLVPNFAGFGGKLLGVSKTAASFGLPKMPKKNDLFMDSAVSNSPLKIKSVSKKEGLVYLDNGGSVKIDSLGYSSYPNNIPGASKNLFRPVTNNPSSMLKEIQKSGKATIRDGRLEAGLLRHPEGSGYRLQKVDGQWTYGSMGKPSAADSRILSDIDAVLRQETKGGLRQTWQEGGRGSLDWGSNRPGYLAEGLVPGFALRPRMHVPPTGRAGGGREGKGFQQFKDRAAGRKTILEPGMDISLAKNSGPFSKVKFDSLDISKIREKIRAGTSDQIHLNKPAFEKYADTLPLKTTSKYNPDTRKLEDETYVNYTLAKKNILDGNAGELSKYFTTKAPAPVAKRTFTPKQEREWREQSERFKREAGQKKSGMYGYYAEGLVPNFIGRANNQDISSRIYEATLGTDLYNKPVSFGDTKVERIEVDGQMKEVAFNNQEQVFKTGVDVKRHFGLRSTPDGGMILPPADTQVGKEARKEFASKAPNAAGGMVPNFADLGPDIDAFEQVKNNPNQTDRVNLRNMEKSLRKGGPLYLQKAGKGPDAARSLAGLPPLEGKGLVSTSRSIENIIKAVGENPTTKQLNDWRNLNDNNKKAFAHAAAANRALTGGAGKATSFKAAREAELQKTSIGIPASIHRVGAGFAEEGLPVSPFSATLQVAKQPYRVSFQGGGIKQVTKGMPAWDDMIENEIAGAMKRIVTNLKFDTALQAFGAQGGRLDALFRRNITSNMLPTIAGNIFDAVISSVAEAGAAFDSTAASPIIAAQETAKKSGVSNLDLQTIPPSVKDILNVPGGVDKLELKHSRQTGLLYSIAKKIFKRVIGKSSLSNQVADSLDSSQRAQFEGVTKKGIKGAAKKGVVGGLAAGFVPNFVDFTDKRFKLNELPAGLPRGVGDAIQREKDAGVPSNAIRVDFPAGQGYVPNLAKMPPIAVTNTRDEGGSASANTAVSNGIRKRLTAYRQANISGNPMLAGTNMEFAAGGIIPNYVITPRDVLQSGAKRGEVSKAGRRTLKEVEREVARMAREGKSPAEIDKYISKKLALEKNLFKEVKAPTRAPGVGGPPIAAKTVETAVMTQLTKQSDFKPLETEAGEAKAKSPLSTKDIKALRTAQADKNLSAYNKVVEKAFNKIQKEVSSGRMTTQTAATKREQLVKATGYQGMKTPLMQRTIGDVLPPKSAEVTPPSDVRTARKKTLSALEGQYRDKRVGQLPKHVQTALGAGSRANPITAQTEFTQLAPEQKKTAIRSSKIQDIKDKKIKDQIRNLTTVKANEMIHQLETTAKGAGKIGAEGRLIAGGAKVDIGAEAVKQKAEAMKVAPRDFRTYESAEQADYKGKSRKARLSSRERALKAYNKDVQADIDMKSAIEGSDEETYKSTRSTQEKAIRLEEQRVKDLQKDLKNKSLNEQLRAAKQKELASRKAIIAENKSQLKAQKASFNKQFGKGIHTPGLQNIAFTAPFALSMAAGFVPESPGGTTAGRLGGAASGGAMGGALGSMALMGGINPWTIAIGLIITTLGAATGAIKKWSPSVEDITRKFKNAQAQTTSTVNAATQYVKVQEQMNTAISSGDVKRQQALVKDISQALNEIVDPKVRSSLLAAGNDMDQLGKEIAELGMAARKESKELALLEGYRGSVDERKTMTNLYGLAGRAPIKESTEKSLSNQLTSILQLGNLSQVESMRSAITEGGDISSIKDTLVNVGGLDEDLVNELMQDERDFAEVLPIISQALNDEAEQIRDSALFEVLQRETSAIKGYDAALTQVATHLSEEFDRIVGYFDQVSGLSKKVFSERLTMSQAAGVVSPSEARDRQIEFDTRQVRASQGMNTEQAIKTLIKEIKEDDFKGSAELEGQYEMILGRFATERDTPGLIEDAIRLSQRQDSDADLLKKLGQTSEAEKTMVDSLKELSAKSTIQIAALHLNNRLAERGQILGGAAQASQMASEDVFSLKRLGESLKATGIPSITSQDQIARLVTDASNFMKARNIEASPEFKEIAMNAQQSELLTNAARTLTAVPGLDFVREQDPNFGFGTRDKMMEFFNLENLKNAPATGQDIVKNRDKFFEDTVRGGAEKEFLNERLFNTPQYQAHVGKMTPENRQVFDQTISSILLGFREIIIEQQRVRQEEKIPNYAERETKSAMAEAFEKAGLSSDEIERLAGDGTNIEYFNKVLAASLEKSPLDVRILDENSKQTRFLMQIDTGIRQLIKLRDFETDRKTKEAMQAAGVSQTEARAALIEDQKQFAEGYKPKATMGVGPATPETSGEWIKAFIEDQIAPNITKDMWQTASAGGQMDISQFFKGGTHQAIDLEQTKHKPETGLTRGMSKYGSRQALREWGGLSSPQEQMEFLKSGKMQNALKNTILQEYIKSAVRQGTESVDIDKMEARMGREEAGDWKSNPISALMGWDPTKGGDLTAIFEMMKTWQAQQGPEVQAESAETHGRHAASILDILVDKLSDLTGETTAEIQEKTVGLSPMDFNAQQGDSLQDINTFQQATLQQVGNLQNQLLTFENLKEKASDISAVGPKEEITEDLSQVLKQIQQFTGTEFLLDPVTRNLATDLPGALRKQQEAMDAIKTAMQAVETKINAARPEPGATPRAAGYVPNFFSQTQVTNQLAQQDNYKDALRREESAQPSKGVVEYSKTLGMHAVYNQGQKSKYGSIDSAIRRDHLSQGQDPNSLYMTGSGKERYFRSGGFVPSFFLPLKKSPAQIQAEQREKEIIAHEKSHAEAAGPHFEDMTLGKTVSYGYVGLNSKPIIGADGEIDYVKSAEKALVLNYAAGAPEKELGQSLSQADKEIQYKTAEDSVRYYTQITDPEKRQELFRKVSKVAQESGLTVPSENIVIREAAKDKKSEMTFGGFVPSFSAPKEDITGHRGYSGSKQRLRDVANPNKGLFKEVLNAESESDFFAAIQTLSIVHKEGHSSSKDMYDPTIEKFPEAYDESLVTKDNKHGFKTGGEGVRIIERKLAKEGKGEVLHGLKIFPRARNLEETRHKGTGFKSFTTDRNIAEKFTKEHDEFSKVHFEIPDAPGYIEEQKVPQSRILNEPRIQKLVDRFGFKEVQRMLGHALDFPGSVGREGLFFDIDNILGAEEGRLQVPVGSWGGDSSNEKEFVQFLPKSKEKAFPIDPFIKRLAARVKEKGGRLNYVGGAVRDYFLGAESKDMDLEFFGISPAEFQAIINEEAPAGQKAQAVGKDFPVFKMGNYDFAAARTETKTGVGHTAFDTEALPFDPKNPEEAFRLAAERRDLTINSMGIDASSGRLIDPLGGLADLQSQTLRATSERFKEDPLRVLRTMQFAGRMGFDADKQLIEYARSMTSEFNSLPQERVMEEWKKWAANSTYPEKGLEFLEQTGWIKHFPGLAEMDTSALSSVKERVATLSQDPKWQKMDASKRATLMWGKLGSLEGLMDPAKAKKEARLYKQMTAPPQLVQGKHLMALGIEPGPAMGKQLKDLYDAQARGDFSTIEDGLAYFEKTRVGIPETPTMEAVLATKKTSRAVEQLLPRQGMMATTKRQGDVVHKYPLANTGPVGQAHTELLNEYQNTVKAGEVPELEGLYAPLIEDYKTSQLFPANLEEARLSKEYLHGVDADEFFGPPKDKLKIEQGSDESTRDFIRRKDKVRMDYFAQDPVAMEKNFFKAPLAKRIKEKFGAHGIEGLDLRGAKLDNLRIKDPDLVNELIKESAAAKNLGEEAHLAAREKAINKIIDSKAVAMVDLGQGLRYDKKEGPYSKKLINQKLSAEGYSEQGLKELWRRPDLLNDWTWKQEQGKEASVEVQKRIAELDAHEAKEKPWQREEWNKELEKRQAEINNQTSSFDTKRPRRGFKAGLGWVIDTVRGRRSEGFVPNFVDFPGLEKAREFLKGVNVDYKDERWGKRMGVSGLSYPGEQRTEVVDLGAAEKQRIEKLIAGDDSSAEEKAIMKNWSPDLKGDMQSLKTTRHEVTHQMWDKFFQKDVGKYMSSNPKSAAGHLRTIIDNTNLFKGNAVGGAYDMTLLEPLLDKIESGEGLSSKENITLDSLRGWGTEGRDPSWNIKGLSGAPDDFRSGQGDFGFPITGIDNIYDSLSEEDYQIAVAEGKDAQGNELQGRRLDSYKNRVLAFEEMLSGQRPGTDTISEKQLFKILSELVVNESMAFGVENPASEGFSLKGHELVGSDRRIEVEKVRKAEKAVAALVGEGDVEAGTKTLNELQQLNITRHLPIDKDLKTKFGVRAAAAKAARSAKVAPEVDKAFETTKPPAMQPKKPEVAYPSLGTRITREDLKNLDYKNNDYYLQPLPATKEAVSELQTQGLRSGSESGIRKLKEEKVDPDNLDAILRLMNPEKNYPDHYFPLLGEEFAEKPEAYRAGVLMRVPKGEGDQYGSFVTDPDGDSSPSVRADRIEGMVFDDRIPLGDEKELLGLRSPAEVAQRPEGPKAQARDFKGSGGREFPPAFQGPQVTTPHISLDKLETLTEEERKTKYDEKGRRLLPPVQREKEAEWNRQERANQITTAIDNFRSSDDPIDKKAVKEYDRHAKSATKSGLPPPTSRKFFENKEQKKAAQDKFIADYLSPPERVEAAEQAQRSGDTGYWRRIEKLGIAEWKKTPSYLQAQWSDNPKVQQAGTDYVSGEYIIKERQAALAERINNKVAKLEDTKKDKLSQMAPIEDVSAKVSRSTTEINRLQDSQKQRYSEKRQVKIGHLEERLKIVNEKTEAEHKKRAGAAQSREIKDVDKQIVDLNEDKALITENPLASRDQIEQHKKDLKAHRERPFEERVVTDRPHVGEIHKTSDFDTKRPPTGIKAWWGGVIDTFRGRRTAGFVPNFTDLPEHKEGLAAKIVELKAWYDKRHPEEPLPPIKPPSDGMLPRDPTLPSERGGLRPVGDASAMWARLLGLGSPTKTFGDMLPTHPIDAGESVPRMDPDKLYDWMVEKAASLYQQPAGSAGEESAPRAKTKEEIYDWLASKRKQPAGSAEEESVPRVDPDNLWGWLPGIDQQPTGGPGQLPEEPAPPAKTFAEIAKLLSGDPADVKQLEEGGALDPTNFLDWLASKRKQPAGSAGEESAPRADPDKFYDWLASLYQHPAGSAEEKSVPRLDPDNPWGWLPGIDQQPIGGPGEPAPAMDPNWWHRFIQKPEFATDDGLLSPQDITLPGQTRRHPQTGKEEQEYYFPPFLPLWDFSGKEKAPLSLDDEPDIYWPSGHPETGDKGGPPTYEPPRPPQDTKLPVHKYPQIKKKEEEKAAEKAAMEKNRKNQQTGEAWKQHRSPDTKAGGAKKPAKYWISTRGEPLGPYSLEQIGQLQKAGDIISDDTHIWKKGFGKDTDSWKVANKYLEERRQEVHILGEEGWHKTDAEKIKKWNEKQLIDKRLLWNPVDGVYRAPPRAEEKSVAPKSKAPTPPPQEVSPEIKKLAPPPKGPTIEPKQPLDRSFWDLLGPDMDLGPASERGGTTPDWIANTRIDYAKRERDFILSQIPKKKDRPTGGGGGPDYDKRVEADILWVDPLDKVLPPWKAERRERYERKKITPKKPQTSSFDTQRPPTGVKAWFGDLVRGGRGRRLSAGFIPNFINNFAIEEISAQTLGASSSVKAHTSRGTIDGRRFTMNNQETEITGPEITQLTGLRPEGGDSFVGPKYGPDLKGELNTRINKKGGRMIAAEGYVPNFEKQDAPWAQDLSWGEQMEMLKQQRAQQGLDYMHSQGEGSYELPQMVYDAAQATIEPEWGFGPNGERVLLNQQAMLEQDKARQKTGMLALGLAGSAAGAAVAPALFSGIGTGASVAARNRTGWWGYFTGRTKDGGYSNI